MKKIALVLVLLITGVGLAPGAPPIAVPYLPAKTTVLRLINDFGAPPFAYLDGGVRKGFEVELGEALAREMGVGLEWVRMPFNIDTYRSALVSGRADAVLSSFTITLGRERYFEFTRPYFITHQAAAIRKGFRDKFNRLDNKLTGAVVGVEGGTTGATWVRKNLSPRRIKTYTSPDRLARALKNGDIQVAILDLAILDALLSRNQYKFEIPKKDLAVENYGIAVGKRNQKLLSSLNEALKKLDGQGIYGRIYGKWFATPRGLPATPSGPSWNKDYDDDEEEMKIRDENF